VSGVVINGEATIIDSLVTDARAPAASGPVVARLAGLDRHGRQVAKADIHGNPNPPPDEPPPFLAALPASDRIVSVAVQPTGGGKPLAKLKASKHAPKGRFLRLPKRASAKKPLTVRWAASDRDRRDRLSVILQARRGRRAWQTITMGPARFKAAVDPKALGSGKKLGLRLVVSDGFTTATVNSRPVAMSG
jgi:hypothetical protein